MMLVEILDPDRPAVWIAPAVEVFRLVREAEAEQPWRILYHRHHGAKEPLDELPRDRMIDVEFDEAGMLAEQQPRR